MTIDEAEKIKMVVENKNYIAELVNAVGKTMVEAFENLKIEDVNIIFFMTVTFIFFTSLTVIFIQSFFVF